VSGAASGESATPDTAVGSLFAVYPPVSSLLLLVPQHFTVPSNIAAQVCVSPAPRLTARVASVAPSILSTNVSSIKVRSSASPFPIWRVFPKPQHFAAPVFINAQV
jgi:hypothetical protein